MASINKMHGTMNIKNRLSVWEVDTEEDFKFEAEIAERFTNIHGEHCKV